MPPVELLIPARNRSSLCGAGRLRSVAAAGACVFLATLLGLLSTVRAQNVGVSTATPDASALLDLETTTHGLLPPRLNSGQMTGITSPAVGDLVYNTTGVDYYYYTGSAWKPVGVGYPWGLTGNSGTSPSTNFLGTIDGEDLVQKTKSVEHLRVYNGGGVGLTNTTNSAESLIFYEASGLGSGYTAFKAGVQIADTLGVISPHYIWPLGGDGLPDQCLVTDGSGDLNWHTFTTFGGSGSQTLWSRGTAAGAEYSDTAGNGSAAIYSIVAGENNSSSGSYAAVWGVGNSASAQGAVLAGGSGNTASAFASTHGGLNCSASASYATTYGGNYDQTSAQYAGILGGDSNKISSQYTVILDGAHNSSSASYQLMFGQNLNLSNNYVIVFRPGTVGTRMGIGTCSPTQAMDVVGRVKFSGSLKPNNTAGSSGQYLLSAGAASPPTWGSATFSSTNWRLLGTSGTSPATNYIGTADAQDLAIRTNNSEHARITSSGNVGVGTTTPAHPLTSILSGTTDETAAIYGEANGATASQAVGVWGSANSASSSNTGTIGLFARGNGNGTAGATNSALQISQGEWTMGRTTASPSPGSAVEPAAGGTLYSQQGPSGVIQLSLGTDLSTTPPIAGVFEDLGTVTINNQFITTSSIVLAGVVQKINGAGDPYPKNSIFKVDVESRSAGSCTIHIGMIPFVTDINPYPASAEIRIAYCIINPGR